MEVFEAMKSRRSIRAFQRRVPAKKLIRECLEAATWAPNPTNQQPWEFVVVTGGKLRMVAEVIVKHFSGRVGGVNPYQGIPRECEVRKNETFELLFSAAKRLEMNGEDLFYKNLTFYGAPVVVFFVTYNIVHNIYRYSVVAAMENFLLAAHAKGLGSCWLSSAAVCQEDIKRLLKIPEEKEIIDSVALGYPVKDSPLNTLPRERLPINKVVRWVGFKQ